ncbi:hypothetical protein FRC11_011318 [Ceratobasidium sp. 423]|nr:hypothetical protein FRC11_011318 [Ceratobasidium sp. 423]
MSKLYTASLLSTLNARKDIGESPTTEENGDTVMAWRPGSMNNPQNSVSPQTMSHQSGACKPNVGAQTPNQSIERRAAAVQIVRMISSIGDDDYEMNEYKDRKRVDSNDIEACRAPAPRVAVGLPRETLSGTLSDEASLGVRS